MDLIADTKRAARLLKCDARTVERRARAGRYRYCVKHGGKWLVNLSKEYPALFGNDRAARIAPARPGMNGGSCNEDDNR